MQKGKDIIRVGDTVKIVNPLIISRIGYEFTYEDARKEIVESFKSDIYELMRKAKVSGWNKIMENGAWDNCMKKIVGALAYDLVSKKIKTGNRRMIYAELQEDLKDEIVTVVSKRTVKTGIYYPPICSGSSYEDYDYEPGGLKDEKTHVILEVDIFNKLTSSPLKIELCDVVKVNR